MWTCPKCGEKIEDQFDSCWKCAAKPEQTSVSPHRLTWSYFILAAPAAILAPLLADSLQSLFVVRGGIRFYQAWYSLYLANPEGLCLFVGVRAVITLAILSFFVRLGFRDRTVWICLALLWFFADYVLEPSVRKL
jgi:hypothetical protein